MRILIVKMSSMGDVIQTLPAVQDASCILPQATFDWLVEPAFADIPAMHPKVGQVLLWPLRNWRKNILTSLKNKEIADHFQKLHHTTYDLIIDAQGSWKSALTASLAKGPKVGFDHASIREPFAEILYHRRFSVSKDAHAIWRTRQLFAQALGYEVPVRDFDYGITAPPQKEGGTILFFTAASRADKLWPQESWVKLTQLAHDAGFTPLFPWGASHEKAQAEQIVATARAGIVLPKHTLKELAHLIVNSQGSIGVDTGLSHLSAALGKPTLTLYGPTDPKRIGTWGKKTLHMTIAGSGPLGLEPAYIWERFKI